MNPNATSVSRRTAWIVYLMLASGLAACASGVPLDEKHVADRSAAAFSPLAQGGAEPTAAPVQVSPLDAPQPHSVARLVYFDYDSFVVKPEFAPLLEANARYLMADSMRRLSLEGHADERGGREYNLALGQKRAEAVRRALTLLGVKDGQIEPVSFGEEKPAESGFTEDAYAKNRRVEFTYR